MSKLPEIHCLVQAGRRDVMERVKRGFRALELVNVHSDPIAGCIFGYIRALC